MRRRLNLELYVGAFMVIGLLCLAYLSIKLGNLAILGKHGYEVSAVFSDTGGLRRGAAVVVAGVDVGHVVSIALTDYAAKVVLEIDPGLAIHDDAIVSIKTSGLIGEKYVQVSAGAADGIIPAGGTIRQTESAVDIESLISKYAFGDL
ncbi:MAG: MlaD family protein [Lentisphaerae bacterium]|nr:MlaD family protein [Lentisphaerota bacterium]